MANIGDTAKPGEVPVAPREPRELDDQDLPILLKRLQEKYRK